MVGSVLDDGSIGAGVGVEGVCGSRVDRVHGVHGDEINGDCRLREGGSDGDLDWVDGGEGDEGEGAGGVPGKGERSRSATASLSQQFHLTAPLPSTLGWWQAHRRWRGCWWGG
jgi:hypothetical protein